MNILVIFNERFDALEFIDMIGLDDVEDHFSIEENIKIAPQCEFHLPGVLRPYAVVLSKYLKYEDAIKSMDSVILSVTEI